MHVEPPHSGSVGASLAGVIVTTVGALCEATFLVVWFDERTWWLQGLQTLIFVVWAVFFWRSYLRLRRGR